MSDVQLRQNLSRVRPVAIIGIEDGCKVLLDGVAVLFEPKAIRLERHSFGLEH
jgi:hypothetical protein